MQNKANFRKSQMNVNLYNTTDYENKSNWTPGENKANSKPIKANLHFTAENAEYAEKKDIPVSYCSIERYALYAISPCSGLGHPVDLRTRRLMKNKANLRKATVLDENIGRLSSVMVKCAIISWGLVIVCKSL